MALADGKEATILQHGITNKLKKEHRFMEGQDASSVSCGQAITREITMQQGCRGEDCHRRYQVYFPTSVCVPTDTSTTATATIGGILPLVFTVH
mmetsp:Transcript_66094/g.130045  ORF Transcript_66094/g.130045 Transcript_66094/m.130045 type:complete len:94 (-) Transcript_66094:51-332(-)